MSTEVEQLDPLFKTAAYLVLAVNRCSVSLLQRRLFLGYNRAYKLTQQLQAKGIIASSNGLVNHKVIVKNLASLETILQENSQAITNNQ